MISNKRTVIVAPYSKLALIYDDLMSHVDYKTWAHYIHQIITKWRPQCHSLLDISAGTGSLLLNMKLRKAVLVGLDYSLAMISLAQKKKKSGQANISFFQGDMTSFHMKRKFDVIVCLYDTINYLTKIEAWRQLFVHVYEALNVKGLFVFDICTEKNSLKYFSNYSEHYEGRTYEYIRHSSYERRKRIHNNDFIISFDHKPINFVEKHRQKIFFVKEVLQFIESTNFHLLGYFDGFTFNVGSEDSLRVHFVLQKNKVSE